MSELVAARLAEMGFAAQDGVVVEVGSGAHGLIWRWPFGRRVAIDPLASFYRKCFDFLQADGASILVARGEALPLGDGVAAVVLSDNVLDHAADPERFVRECWRILAASGVLYFTVDVHHAVWALFGAAYNLAYRLGLHAKVQSFPHHPFHFQQRQVEAMLDAAGFDVVARRGGTPERSGLRPRRGPMRLYDLLKRVFFRNARLEIVAVARPAGGADPAGAASGPGGPLVLLPYSPICGLPRGP